MGKDFNRRFTVNLEISTKDAEKQVKVTAKNLETILADLDKKTDKMTVFKELSDYLKQVDEQLTSFKKKHGDELFGQMFGGLDKNLQKEMEKIFGVAKDQMTQLTQLKERVSNAKENGISENEIKELEQLTRSLYDAIGLKGEAKLSGRGKIETRLANLENSLNNFALAYENVNNRVSQGFNFDVSGGQSGTSAINKKIDETIKKMKELEKVQEDLNNVAKIYNNYQSKKTIEDKIKPTIKDIERLVRAYDKATKKRDEFKKSGDTTSAAYHQNELEIARLSLQGKYLTEQHVDNNDDLEEKLSNKKIGGFSLLEHLEEMFSNADEYSNKLIKVQDVVKTAMDNLHADLSQLEQERDDLAQRGTKGDFLNQAKQKIKEINDLKTSINDGIIGGSLKDEDISGYLVKVTELSTEFKNLAQSAEMSEEEIKDVENIIASLNQSLNDNLSKALKQKGKNPIVAFYEDSASEVKKAIDKIAKLDKQFEDAGKPGIQMNAFDKANPSDLQREYIIEAFREYKKNQESSGKIDTNNASEKDIELLEKQLRLIQVIQEARIKGASAQDYGNLYGLDGKELSGFYSLLNDKSYAKYIYGAFDKLRQAISKNREKLVAGNEVIAKLIKENEDAWRQFADGKGDSFSGTDQINRKLEEKAAENVKEQKRFNELKSQFDTSIKEFTDAGLIDVSGNEQNAYNDILDGIRKNTIQTVEDCKKKFAELAKLDYDELSKKAKELKAQTPAQTGTGGVSGQVKNDVEDAKNRLKELNKIKDEHTGIIDSLNRRKKKTDIKVTKDNDVVVLKQQLDILKQAKEEYLKSKNGTEEEIEAYGKLIKAAKDYQTVVGFIKKSGSENARETIVDKDYLEGSNIANHYLSGMSQGYMYVVKRHFEEMLKSVESDIANQNTLLSKQLAIEQAITKEREKRVATQKRSEIESIYQSASDTTKGHIDRFYTLQKQRDDFLNNIKGVKLDNFNTFEPTDFQKNYILETYKELKRVVQEISSIDVVNTDDDKKRLRDLQEEAMRLQRTLGQAHRPDGNAYSYMDNYGLSSDEAIDFYDAIRGDKKYKFSNIEKDILNEYTRGISEAYAGIVNSDDKLTKHMLANTEQWDQYVLSRLEALQTAQDYQQQLHEKLSAMATEAQRQEQIRIQEQNAINQLAKNFKDEISKTNPLIEMSDDEDDAFDTVIEGIRNKTFTTVDECIAKFRELTTVIETVDDNIPNTGAGNAQVRVGSQTTGMEDLVSGVSSSEIQDLENLRLKLVEVKRAINDKTDAFQKEATEVGGAVSTEITALTKLLNVLKTISTQIGSIIISLNNINVGNIDEEFATATNDMLQNAKKIQKVEIAPNDLDEMPGKIKDLTKAFIDALSEMDNLDNIKLGANVDDAYTKVLENIKNKTFTTVEECIAKFKELTFVGEMDDLDKLNNKLVAVKYAVDSKTNAFKNEAIEVGNAVATEMTALTKLKKLLEEIQGILQTVFDVSRGNFGDIEISDSKDNVNKVSNAIQNIQRTLSQILGVLQGFTGIESEGKNSVKVKEPAVNNTLSGNEFEGVAEKLRDVATEKTLRSLRRSLLGIEKNTQDNKSAEIDDMKSVVSSLVDSITANVKSLKDVTDNVVQYKKDEDERRKKNVDTATQTRDARDLIGKESDEASVTITKTGDKAVKTTKKVGAEIAQVVKTTNDGVISTTVTMSNAYKIAMEKTKKQLEDFDSKGYFGELSQNGSNVEAKNLYAEYTKTYYDLKEAMLEYDAAANAGMDTTKIQQKINALQGTLGGLENRLINIANNSKTFMQNGTIIGNLDGDEIEKSADSLKRLVVSTESLSVAFHGVFNDGSRLVYEVLDNGTIKRYAVEVDEATGVVKKMEASQYGLVNAMQKVNDAAKQNAELDNILSADGNVNNDSTLIKNYMQKRQDLNDAVNDAFNKAANNGGIVDKEDLDIIYAMSQEVIRLGNVINSEYNRISKLINKGGLFNSLGDTTGTTEERMRQYMHDYAYGNSKSLSNVQYDSAAQTMTADLVNLSGVITKVKVEYSELFDGIQISSLKGTKSIDETAQKIKTLQAALDNMAGHIDQNSQEYTDYKDAVLDLDAVIKQFNDGTLSFNDENITWWNTLRNSVLSYGNALLSATKNNKAELVSGKSQKTVSFNQYANSVKDAKYLTEDLREELNALKALLEDIDNAGDLSNWQDQFDELKGRIAEARAEYNKQDDQKRVDLAKSNQDLKSIKDKADNIKKSLKLDPLDTSDEVVAIDVAYNDLMKKIDAYKARRKALTEEELAGLREILEQLRTNAKAYADQHPKDEKNKKTYGTGIIDGHTSKYNKMDSYKDLLQESNEYKKLYEKYIASYKNVQEAYNDIETKGENDDTIKKFKEASAECNILHRELERLLSTYNKLHSDPNKIGEQKLFGFINTAVNRQNALGDYVQSMHGNKAKIEGFKNNYRELIYTIDNGDGTFTKAKARINNLGTAIVETAGDTSSATTKFGKVFEEIGKKFGSLSTYFVSMVSVQEVFQFLRQGVTYVREIDAALTELKKVTDETDATYDKFLQNMSKTASVVGSSVSELTTMAAEWAKLGYSIEESAKLAESTAILLNVSEFEDATTASEALISTMQAFKYTANESQHVVDILNEVKVTCLLIQ